MAVARQGALRRGCTTALEILVVAGLYYGSARLGLLQELVRRQVTPLWPPTGIAVASLLLRGPRLWPGIALGALLANLDLGPSFAALFLIVVGNTLAPLCSYALLRLAGFRHGLDRLYDALALIFLGAFAGMLISATAGSGTLALSGALTTDRFWPTWWVWWTGDAMGVLVVTPVLLVLSSARLPRNVPVSRRLEALLLVVAVACVGFVETGTTPLLFLGFPLLIWAAFRFRLAGAAPCALAVSTFAIYDAARGAEPFGTRGLLTDMITLQAYNASSALTALLVAAAVSERERSQREIARACGHLAELVSRLSDTGTQPALPAVDAYGARLRPPGASRSAPAPRGPSELE
ncbi:MASE1 domain-containing protein [Streptomyces sp. NEAU-sy36]|uniref:MASE1 domain-containing protein n=1 Tax=unclassified Streptomyces TaxID=2593676 RepID=UPI0015D576AD|nr:MULTISPECIES: MASE1 domain-containing protein [unclassified Streptomyces]QLJ04393.1 MASE1 domain-containing protein [Streptomyces sp. NEAU-sy36]